MFDSKLKVTKELNHFRGRERYIVLTLDGEEASEYFDSVSEAQIELLRLQAIEKQREDNLFTQVDRKLTAEGIDPRDYHKCIETLSKCCLPKVLIESYKRHYREGKYAIYFYRLRRLKGGSDRYGPCDVCKKDVDTTYSLVQQRVYVKPDGKESLTHNQCFSKFGHEKCVTCLTNQ